MAELAAALEPDVRVLVDAAHAPGMIDFDVAASGASYLTANCHKWMCSAKGAGFLWVRPDRRDDMYHSVISHGYNGGWRLRRRAHARPVRLDGDRRSERLAHRR